MTTPQGLGMVLNIGLAVVLGAIVGWERERRSKPAGIRTHALVALGAALYAAVGSSVSRWGDPTRVAAQVVSGIGFIGAGAIIRSGTSVRGITTAATLWVAAAIGVACGLGFVVLAPVVAALDGLVTLALGAVRSRVKRHLLVLHVDYEIGSGLLGSLMGNISAAGAVVRSVMVSETSSTRRSVAIEVEGGDESGLNAAFSALASEEGVLRFEVET